MIKSAWLNSYLFFCRKLTNKIVLSRKASKAICPPRQVWAKHKLGPHRCPHTEAKGEGEVSGSTALLLLGPGKASFCQQMSQHGIAGQTEHPPEVSVSVSGTAASQGRFPIKLTLTKNLWKEGTTWLNLSFWTSHAWVSTAGVQKARADAALTALSPLLGSPASARSLRCPLLSSFFRLLVTYTMLTQTNKQNHGFSQKL